MIPFCAVVILFLAGMLVFWISDGYVNTVDSLAYMLKMHAERTRQRHEDRAKVVRDRWVKELEA